ncbi:MAG: metallophosphoesterase [Candidatus Helarchaeota archaeon]|nr:metallophosphoesterase [Candidatus Helarchaeota archaeon]
MAFSDFHGLFGLTNHFREVKKRIIETHPDILIFCGDFRNQISVVLLESRLRRLKFPAIYYVFGNSDLLAPDYELKVGVNLHLKLIQVNDEFAIAGIGGDELDVNWNIEIFDEILLEVQSKKLILVSHVPPFGFCDFAVDGKHVGSNALRMLVEKYKPKLCIFGHIHENSGKSAILNKTIFWNVGEKGVVLEL